MRIDDLRQALVSSRPSLAKTARAANSIRREVGEAAGHAFGNAIDRAVTAHHARRLRKVGWQHALEADGSEWAAGRVPGAVGQQGRGPHRRGRVPADGRRRAGEGGVARPSHRLLLLAGARAHARGRAHDRAKPARGAGRADRRARSHLERRSGSDLQPLASRGAGDGRAVQPEKPDPLRVRLLRSVHALPSREDDRHRRPRRIRRRHRPHARRWRPVRQPGSPFARSDRLARRRHAHRRARSRRCRRALSPALACGGE